MYNFGMTISTPDTDPDQVFKTLSDYERYPELTEAVLRASVVRGDDGHERCTWEVKFRRGILVWTEDGIVDAAQRRIEFSLVDGDLDALDGHWHVAEAASGSAIVFACSFDMGIPTLEHLIEPVAADALRENVVSMCQGLFGAAEVVEESSGVPQ